MNYGIWIGIIFAFLLACIISLGGIYSAGKGTHNQARKDWKNFFSTSPVLKCDEQINQPKCGIGIIVFGNCGENEDNFLPFLTFASSNLFKEANLGKSRLTEDGLNQYDNHPDHDNPIINYLQGTSQDLNDMNIYLLHSLKNHKNLEKKGKNYTKKLNLVDITFDKLIYNV